MVVNRQNQVFRRGLTQGARWHGETGVLTTNGTVCPSAGSQRVLTTNGTMRPSAGRQRVLTTNGTVRPSA